MDIRIDNKSINIGGQSLSYDSYYLNVDEFEGLSNGFALKKILEQWTAVLVEPGSENRTLFLPFSFNDEWIECLRATEYADKLMFKHVWVDENGWSVDVNDLRSFINTTHRIAKESSEVIGEYDKDEVVSALINVKIVND